MREERELCVPWHPTVPSGHKFPGIQHSNNFPAYIGIWDDDDEQAYNKRCFQGPSRSVWIIPAARREIGAQVGSLRRCLVMSSSKGRDTPSITQKVYNTEKGQEQSLFDPIEMWQDNGHHTTRNEQVQQVHLAKQMKMAHRVQQKQTMGGERENCPAPLFFFPFSLKERKKKEWPAELSLDVNFSTVAGEFLLLFPSYFSPLCAGDPSSFFLFLIHISSNDGHQWVFYRPEDMTTTMDFFVLLHGHFDCYYGVRDKHTRLDGRWLCLSLSLSFMTRSIQMLLNWEMFGKRGTILVVYTAWWFAWKEEKAKPNGKVL